MKCLKKTTSGAAGIGLGTTIKYPRRTTGAAAGSGLGTTPNYLLRAAEPESRQHIWRGGSLPPGYSWQQS